MVSGATILFFFFTTFLIGFTLRIPHRVLHLSFPHVWSVAIGVPQISGGLAALGVIYPKRHSLDLEPLGQAHPIFQMGRRVQRRSIIFSQANRILLTETWPQVQLPHLSMGSLFNLISG